MERGLLRAAAAAAARSTQKDAVLGDPHLLWAAWGLMGADSKHPYTCTLLYCVCVCV